MRLHCSLSTLHGVLPTATTFSLGGAGALAAHGSLIYDNTPASGAKTQTIASVATTQEAPTMNTVQVTRTAAQPVSLIITTLSSPSGETGNIINFVTNDVAGGGVNGTHAGDVIGEIALAIEMGADAVDIGKTIHPHPTLGESIGMAAEVAHGSCTDVPPSKK